jgi:hypothetical protein
VCGAHDGECAVVTFRDADDAVLLRIKRIDSTTHTACASGVVVNAVETVTLLPLIA